MVHSALLRRAAITRIYARACANIFSRVATALENNGLKERRYQIIRNFLCRAKNPREQYNILRSLLTTLTT